VKPSDGSLRSEHDVLLARLVTERKTLGHAERAALTERLTVLGRMILALKTADRRATQRARRSQPKQVAD
jgi:hypothetical protein